MQASTSAEKKKNHHTFRLRILIGVLFILVSTAFALYRGMPAKAVQYIIFKNISSIGGHDIHLDQIKLTRNQTTIYNLTFKVGQAKHEVVIPQIQATYFLSKLYKGNLEGLTLQGSKIILNPDPEAPMPTLSEMTQSMETTLKTLNAIGKISIDNIEIEMRGAVQPFKITGEVKQQDQQNAYDINLQGEHLKAHGTIMSRNHILTINLELKDVHLPSEKFKFETPELKIELEKSLGSDLIKIKTQGQINQLDLSSYGHLISPFVIEAALQKTDSLVTGTALLHLKDNAGSEKVFISPDFDFVKLTGKIQVDADFSPHKFWRFDQLLPHFIPPLSKIEGHVKAEGEIKWNGTWKDMDTNLKINIQDGIAHMEDLIIKGLNTDFSLSKLFPFITSQTQTIKVSELIYKHLPLTQVVADISTSNEGLIKFHSFKSNLFGGDISLHTFHQHGKTIEDGIQFKADCNNIELSDLIKYSDIVDLQAEAKLIGEGDFKYSSKGLEVLQATLRSTSSEGRLYYKTKGDPEHVENQAAEIALKALEDLHFTLLEIIISPNESTPENDIQAQIKLLGFNPKVLNGYPFEFNIQTTGQLGDLMRNAINNLAPVKSMDDVNKRLINQ